MHLLDQAGSLSERSFTKNLGSTLRQIRFWTGIESDILQEVLSATARDYARIMTGELAPSLEGLEFLARLTGLSMELILSGKIDFPALRKQFQGNHRALPARYHQPERQLSRTRSVQVIYQFLLKFHGSDFANRAFNKLQIFPEAFDNLDGYVSTEIPVDLFAHLRREGMNESAIRLAGSMSSSVNAGNIGAILSGCSTPRALYEYALSVLVGPTYDRAFNYQLHKVTDDSCMMRILPSAESIEVFQGRPSGDRNICLYKQGVYLSFLSYASVDAAHVEETECLYMGGRYCEYHVYWAKSRKPRSKPLS